MVCVMVCVVCVVFIPYSAYVCHLSQLKPPSLQEGDVVVLLVDVTRRSRSKLASVESERGDSRAVSVLFGVHIHTDTQTDRHKPSWLFLWLLGLLLFRSSGAIVFFLSSPFELHL